MIAAFFSRLLLGLAKFFGFFMWGRERERRKRLEDAIEKGRDARDAARKERDETADLDDDAVLEQLRDRTDKFKR